MLVFLGFRIEASVCSSSVARFAANVCGLRQSAWNCLVRSQVERNFRRGKTGNHIIIYSSFHSIFHYPTITLILP